MEQINFFLSNFCLTYQNEVIQYLDKCHAYIKDLLSFKKITIYSQLGQHTDFQKKEIIKNIISSTNSALNTIGIPIEELLPTEFLFEKVYTQKINSYRDYNEFYENELKRYVNNYLFNSLIEYIAKFDEKKVENLDLFDLLPSKFKDKLIHYRINHPISPEEEQILLEVLQNINHYINLSDITINLGSFNNPPIPQAPSSEEDIIDQLKKAKESTINLIQHQDEIETDINYEYLKKDLEDLKGAILELGEDGTTFAHNFGNFHQLKENIITKLAVNHQNLYNCIESNPEFLDLETLFYLISIGKMIRIEMPFNPSQIIAFLKSYVNNRVFSSSVYHKPNPISNAYGLSILSELDLIEQTEIIDLLDIEMSLENEFSIFIPEKLLLNFYALVGLKILEKKGNIITDKNNLLKELISLDVSTFSDKSIPLDMLCHLGTIKLIQDGRDITRLKTIYYVELKSSLKENGSINNNLTDSARALLVLKLLDLDNPNEELIKILMNYINANNQFFVTNDSTSEFHWNNDPLALKVELRMLFWVCLALSQLEDLI